MGGGFTREQWESGEVKWRTDGDFNALLRETPSPTSASKAAADARRTQELEQRAQDALADSEQYRSELERSVALSSHARQGEREGTKLRAQLESERSQLADARGELEVVRRQLQVRENQNATLQAQLRGGLGNSSAAGGIETTPVR